MKHHNKTQGYRNNRVVSLRRILSGPKSKEYRKQLVIASGGKIPAEEDKTLKSFLYPLEINKSYINEDQLERLQEEHLIFSSTNDTSLFSFFILIHLCGFRLYPTHNAVRIAAAIPELETYFNDHFSAAFKEVTDSKEFINFYLRLVTGIRGDKNKDKLIKIYSEKFSITTTDKNKNNSETTNSPSSDLGKVLDECVNSIARKGIFGETDEDSKKRIAAFDEAWHKVQPRGKKRYPTLSSIPIKDVKPKKTTLLFSPDPQNYGLAEEELKELLKNKNSNYALHQIISKTGMMLKKSGKQLKNNNYKDLITGGKEHSGLSWLFNAGIDVFAETDLASLMKKFNGISKKYKRYISKLRHIAASIKDTDCGQSFHEYRSLFGGQIDSWVTSYLKRLSELEMAMKDISNWQGLPWNDLTKELTDDIRKKIEQDFNSATAIEVKQLQESIDHLIKSESKKIRELIHILQGKGNKCASVKNIKEIEKFNNHITDIEGRYNELTQIYARNTTNNRGGDEKIELPKWLRNTSIDKQHTEFEEYSVVNDIDYSKRKLNQYRGSTIPNIAQKIKESKEELEKLVKSRSSIFDQLEKDYKLNPTKSINSFIEKHEQMSQNHQGAYENINCHELGFRQILNRIGNSWRYSEKEIALRGSKMYKKHGIFLNQKKRNAYFLNQLGDLYKHPLSTRKDSPYKLGGKWENFSYKTTKNQKKFQKLLEAFQQEIESLRKDYPYQRSTHTLFNTYYNIMLSGLDPEVENKTALVIIESVGEDRVPSIWLNIAQNQKKKKIPRALFLKIFNLYNSKITGLSITTSNLEYFIKYRFQRVGDNHLYYLPKERTQQASVKPCWNIPEHYFQSKKPLTSGLKKLKELGYIKEKSLADIVGARIRITSDNGSIFSLKQKNALLKQLPKPKEKIIWHIPEHYFQGKKPLANGLKKLKKLGYIKEKSLALGIKYAKKQKRINQDNIIIDVAKVRSLIDNKLPLKEKEALLGALPSRQEPVQASNEWQVPPHFINGKTLLAKGLRFLQEEGYIDDNLIMKDLPATVEFIYSPQTNLDKDIKKSLLLCLPHDWYYDISQYIPPEKEPVSYPQGMICIEKSNKPYLVLGKKKKNKMHLVRLRGPYLAQSNIDNAVVGKKTIRDISLIVKENYDNKKDIINRRDVDFIAAIPFALNNQQDRTKRIIKNEFPFDNYVSIDLGEYGIGYAVFSLRQSMETNNLVLIRSGYTHIHEIEQLINRVKHHRKSKQPRQKFLANIDHALMNMRKSAIAATASNIEGLMKKYNAFPVFESTVGGFETGANQLRLIYKSVLNLYLFSDVDAHKNKRADHWGVPSNYAPMWQHPKLKVKKYSQGRIDYVEAPLNIFPGTSISPYGTSQTCSFKQVNPIEVIRSMPKPFNELESDQNGKLKLSKTTTLSNGETETEEIYIYIFKNNLEEPLWIQRLRHKLKLAKIPCIAPNEKFNNLGDLEKHVKKNLRIRPLDSRSGDTSQSIYCSPFVFNQKEKAAAKELREKIPSRYQYNDRLKRKYDTFIRSLEKIDSKKEPQKAKEAKAYIESLRPILDHPLIHADLNAAINIGRKWWKEKIISLKEKKS